MGTFTNHLLPDPVFSSLRRMYGAVINSGLGTPGFESSLSNRIPNSSVLCIYSDINGDGDNNICLGVVMIIK